MKFCIVNADDFGADTGINRGIAEAHTSGIVTSTSLMVNMPGTEDAVELSRKLPGLGVGLHVNLTNEGGPTVVDLDDETACRVEILNQLRRFRLMTGGLPTHLDAHHNIHRDARLRQIFVELARKYGLPLRESCQVRYLSKFYGQWDGETHLEQIAVDSLLGMLETEIEPGFTELSCHPGYITEGNSSSYGIEREFELATLCDSRVRERIEALGITLISYRELPILHTVGEAG